MSLTEKLSCSDGLDVAGLGVGEADGREVAGVAVGTNVGVETDGDFVGADADGPREGKRTVGAFVGNKCRTRWDKLPANPSYIQRRWYRNPVA